MSTPRPLSWKSTIPAVLMLLAAGTLGASASQDVVVKVPFEFQAGGTHFDPGVYRLSMDSAVSGSVIIQSADLTRRAVLLTRKSISDAVQSAPVVMFRTYGESRFLSVIQGESASQRWEVVPTAAQVSLARQSEQPMVASLSASGSGTN